MDPLSFGERKLELKAKFAFGGRRGQVPHGKKARADRLPLTGNAGKEWVHGWQGLSTDGDSTPSKARPAVIRKNCWLMAVWQATNTLA